MPTITPATFAAGLPYDQYLAAGKPHEIDNWKSFHSRIKLTQSQKTLLGSFTRKINALCISGTWCGDCVQQVPFFDHIARAIPTGLIDMRFLERDAHKDLMAHYKICGGDRVPVLILMNEDLDFCALEGDRTLNRYRALASRQLGASCPLPGAPVPADEIASQLQDWVDAFERVHLMLRLSTKLRQRHGD